jgi:hypothetical protein
MPTSARPASAVVRPFLTSWFIGKSLRMPKATPVFWTWTKSRTPRTIWRLSNGASIARMRPLAA